MPAFRTLIIIEEFKIFIQILLTKVRIHFIFKTNKPVIRKKRIIIFAKLSIVDLSV